MPTATQKKRLAELERQLGAKKAVVTFVVVYKSPPPKQPLQRRNFENVPAIRPVSADRTSCERHPAKNSQVIQTRNKTGPEGLKPMRKI